MRDVARLYEQLRWKKRDRLPKDGGSALKRGMTAPSPGCEFLLKCGKRLSIQDDREGLKKAVNGSQRDRPPRNSRIFEQERDERRGQPGEVDGQKDGEPRRCGFENGANSAQRTQSWIGVGNDGRIRLKRRAGAADRYGQTRCPQGIDRAAYHGLTVEIDERLVCSHPA